MQLLSLKKARFNLALEPLQTSILKSFLPDFGSSGLSSIASFFPSSLLLIPQPTNLLSSFSLFCFQLRIPLALDY